MNKARHEEYMRAALAQAQKAFDKGEVPVGAVVVKDGLIIAAGHNMRQQLKDPSAHAEIIAMREAAKVLGDWRLSGCTLYVTLEPCPMCAGAISQSRMEWLVYGAFDEKAGCAGSVYELCGDSAIGGSTKIIGGVLEEKCAELLSRFFQQKR
jgi:tRNA(adenine34) deaminase